MNWVILRCVDCGFARIGEKEGDLPVRWTHAVEEESRWIFWITVHVDGGVVLEIKVKKCWLTGEDVAATFTYFKLNFLPTVTYPTVVQRTAVEGLKSAGGGGGDRLEVESQLSCSYLLGPFVLIPLMRWIWISEFICSLSTAPFEASVDIIGKTKNPRGSIIPCD